ncbi:MAG: hypothetical protein WGN25_14225 [Candidatus Electrothrix sp. GW3-4]|uniref:hypothetical protein n=1 Tax=Candidatus Electrothrix sp. GW3-4 TaxID=3126740 RepID=UPI0030D4B8E6
MPYLKLIEKELKIVAEPIFTDDAKFFDIFEKINNAANAMKGRLGDMTGINICIHVASSFVMLGAHIEQYHKVVKDIKEQFKGVDPTVIITSAALYYLFKKIEHVIKEEDAEELKSRYLDHVEAKINATGKQMGEEKRQRIISEFESFQDQLHYIYTRFDLMNWMIGESYMEKLNIVKTVNRK